MIGLLIGQKVTYLHWKQFLLRILQILAADSESERLSQKAKAVRIEIVEKKQRGERNRQFGNKWRATVDALHLKVNGNDPCHACLCFAPFVFTKLTSFLLFLFSTFLWKKTTSTSTSTTAATTTLTAIATAAAAAAEAVNREVHDRYYLALKNISSTGGKCIAVCSNEY